MFRGITQTRLVDEKLSELEQGLDLRLTFGDSASSRHKFHKIFRLVIIIIITITTTTTTRNSPISLET